jgi:hypothetical protein
MRGADKITPISQRSIPAVYVGQTGRLGCDLSGRPVRSVRGYPIRYLLYQSTVSKLGHFVDVPPVFSKAIFAGRFQFSGMFDSGRWTRKDHERLNRLLRSPRSTVKSVAHLNSKLFCVSVVCAEGRTAELGQSRCTGSKLTQLPTVMQPLCCGTSFGMGGAAADGADGTFDLALLGQSGSG